MTGKARRGNRARLLLLCVSVWMGLSFARPGLAATYTMTTLHDFCNLGGACSDGALPWSTLVMDDAGNLYGTTEAGGPRADTGVVFKLSANQDRTAWTETVLYNFCREAYCDDGDKPYAGLTLDKSGNLFGTARLGGGTNNGTVFELSRPQVSAPKEDQAAWVPTWTARMLHHFCLQGGTCDDGGLPGATLLRDTAGTIYGTAYFGGNPDANTGMGGGTVFALIPSQSGTGWNYKTIYRFCAEPDCADGALPYAGVITDGKGNFYGTTYQGGTYKNGVAYVLSPSSTGTTWQQTVLYTFCQERGCIDGAGPEGGLMKDKAGNLYGTTYGGGTWNGGTVFELTRNQNGTGWTHTVLYNFCSQADCADGNWPYDNPIVDRAGNLYGTTRAGGAHGGGMVFELRPNVTSTAWTFVDLYDFCADPKCADGSQPVQSLVMDANGNLYGTAWYGGAGNAGTVFELRKSP